MTKYEHKLITGLDLITVQQSPSSLGSQGWRVVACLPGGVLVLEREVR